MRSTPAGFMTQRLENSFFMEIHHLLLHPESRITGAVAAVAFLTRLSREISGERPEKNFPGVDLDSTGCGWPLC
jgi:hypothetical protein